MKKEIYDLIHSAMKEYHSSENENDGLKKLAQTVTPEIIKVSYDEQVLAWNTIADSIRGTEDKIEVTFGKNTATKLIDELKDKIKELEELQKQKSSEDRAKLAVFSNFANNFVATEEQRGALIHGITHYNIFSDKRITVEKPKKLKIK